MTTPERKIAETAKLLDDPHTSEAAMLRQILSNQETLLRAVKVLLSWDRE